MVLNDFTPEKELDKLGKLLVEEGKLSPEQVSQILLKQKETNLRFGEAAIALGFIKKDAIDFAIAKQFSHSYAAEKSDISHKLYMAYSSKVSESEKIKGLRSDILLNWLAKGNKAFQVTGVDVTGEDHVLAANLAIAFAQVGKKVLLIDADIKSPHLGPLFGFKNAAGLSDILAGRAALTACVSPIAEIKGLDFLSSGAPTPNSHELLSKNSFGDFISFIQNIYDIIICSTSPLTDSYDAQILASEISGVLMVAVQNKTKVEHLKLAVEKLQVSHASVMGCVYVS